MGKHIGEIKVMLFNLSVLIRQLVVDLELN